MTGASLDSDVENHVETSPNGRYIRYNSVLGKGAYKTVYKAFDTEEALEVAWNKLHVDRLSEHDLEKVSTEVSLLRQVEHNNIIHFYDTWRGTDANGNKTINFITERMMSGTLKEYLKKAKAIKLKVIRRWCCNILEAIAYLHSQSPPIMHRDLKCDNIFINGHVGEVKIGDLGLSGVKEREKADSVIGTPEFMAPELYEESYTEKVDIYAFGMCLLEIVSMEYPYSECNNMAQIFKKVFNGEKPHAFGMLVDGDVKDVIAVCLQREARRPSALDLLTHPLFSEWEVDDGSVSNLSLVKGVPDIATGTLEAASSSIEMPMPIGTELIDWSDPLKRNVLVSMIEGDHAEGHEQQQEISVVATRENGGFYIGLEIPIRDAVKRVEFTFDPFEDSSQQIAQDMVTEFGLGTEQLSVIREEIDQRVRAAKNHRAAASRNATPQSAPRNSESALTAAASSDPDPGPAPTPTSSLSSPSQSFRNSPDQHAEHSKAPVAREVLQSTQHLPSTNANGSHEGSNLARRPDVDARRHDQRERPSDNATPTVTQGDVEMAEPANRERPQPSPDVYGSVPGLPLTSSFRSSQPASSTSAETPTGVLSPPTDQPVQSAGLGVSQSRHENSLGPDTVTGLEQSAMTSGLVSAPELGAHDSSSHGSGGDESVSNKSAREAVGRATSSMATLGLTAYPKDSAVHRSQDDSPSHGSTQYDPSVSTSTLGADVQHRRPDPDIAHQIPQSVSDGQLGPNDDVTVLEIPSRPATLPPTYGRIEDVADDMRASTMSAAPYARALPINLENAGTGGPALPDTSSVEAELDRQSNASAKEPTENIHRSTSGNMPKIVVVGNTEASTRHGGGLLSHSLPVFSSESATVPLQVDDPSSSFLAHESQGLIHSTQTMVPLHPASDVIVRNNSSSSQQRSPTEKSGTMRTSSWKSMQSDDSGNNIVPKVPAGQIIGDEHDQKYYAMCLKLLDHCAKGKLDAVRKKLSEGANPRFSDYDRRTPLHLASTEGHASVCALLLDCGAKVDARDRWANTPLADAVENGHVEVQILLKSRGAVDEKRSEMDNLNIELMRYSASGDLESVRSRIVAGADATYSDYDHRTPLHLACSEGHLEVVELLLVNGASPNAKDRKNRSSVDDAVKNGHRDILRVLRQYGAIIPKHLFEAQPELENQKGLDLVEHAAKGREGAVRLALEQGANPNFEDYDRRTALHLACVEGRLNVVRTLLYAGARVSARDRWGCTPFDEAKKGGFVSILDELSVWESKKKQKQVPIVSFDNNTMVMNGHDRDVIVPKDSDSAHFDQLKHGIASSVSMGAMPSMPLSADEFANHASSSTSGASQSADKTSSISLPQTPFSRSGDSADVSNSANEIMLLQKAYAAEKQRLEEQHQKALEDIKRKKSVESLKSSRGSVGGVPVVNVVGSRPSESAEYERHSTVHVGHPENAEGQAVNSPLDVLPNGTGGSHSDRAGPASRHVSAIASSMQTMNQELLPRRDVGVADEQVNNVNPDIRRLVDNLIDAASTQR